MDVLSLGSSTVELHSSLRSRRACACSEIGFSSQSGDRAEGIYATEKQRSVVRFLWAKGLNAKDIHNEMFPVYSGKCLLRNEDHNGVEKFFRGL
jgi:hypothetical protein